jgi:hypothetical protein
MTCERYNPGIPYLQAGHLQAPWWAGYNASARGEDYRNDYATLTARFEYQQGYLTGVA